MKGEPLYPKNYYWAPVWNNGFDKEIVWVQICGAGGFEVADDAYPQQMAEGYDDPW